MSSNIVKEVKIENRKKKRKRGKGNRTSVRERVGPGSFVPFAFGGRSVLLSFLWILNVGWRLFDGVFLREMFERAESLRARCHKEVKDVERETAR